MDKRNGAAVPLKVATKRLRATGQEKRAAALADVTEALRHIPADVADDLLDRFARDVRRARSYWDDGSPE